MEAVTSPARARSATRSSALVQTVDIETPELVTFSYTIAGVGSRVAAALIDYLLCLVLFIALLITLAFVGASRLVSFGGTSSEAWALAIVVLGQFFILWGYYVLWEGLAGRLLWGCDLTMCTGLAKLRALDVIGVKGEDLENIRWKNAARIFPKGSFQ